MKFPCREYISRLPGTNDFQIILRPVISIRISGPKATGNFDALVDTGADETLLPLCLVDLLGCELEPNLKSQAIGISGNKLEIHYAEVKLEIIADNESVQWKSMIGFIEFESPQDEVIILGHGGCLDYFTASFDGEHAELELISNTLLPA